MPVYAYKGKKGITYHIVYFVNGKRKKETIGGDKKLAEAVLHKRLTEITEGKYLDVKREEKIKFEDFADHYLEVYCKPNHKSFKSDINNIKALKRFFSDRYLYEITPEDIERFKGERTKEGVTPATVNRSLAWLKSMFNRAIEWKKVKENPVRKVKLFKENNQRLRYLEKEEITKLLDNCSEHLRPIVIVALHTGMRRGEILNLKWRDIDFKRDIIYLFNTKNGERREVPMNDLVKKTLIAVRKYPDSPYIFYNKYNKDGKPYGDIKKSFFTACKNTGIMNFHFHDLRHTFASHLAMRGVDLNRIRKLLGHKTLQMTFRYAHLSPGYLKQAVDILAQDFCENKVKTAPKLPQEEILKIGEDSVLLEPIENKALVNLGP